MCSCHDRVFEKTVEWVEHIVRQQEEELSGNTTVVQTFFTIELDHKSLLQVIGCLSHNLLIRVFKDMISSNLDVTLSRQNTQSRLRSKVDDFSSKVTLVLGNILVQRRRQTRVVPCGSFRVVVNEVHTGSVGQTHLPARGQRTQLTHWLLLDGGVWTKGTNVLLSSRVNPGGGSCVVVHKVWSSLIGKSLLPSGRQLAQTSGGAT